MSEAISLSVYNIININVIIDQHLRLSLSSVCTPLIHLAHVHSTPNHCFTQEQKEIKATVIFQLKNEDLFFFFLLPFMDRNSSLSGCALF